MHAIFSLVLKITEIAFLGILIFFKRAHPSDYEIKKFPD